MNEKKLLRLYREEGLQVRRRRGRKRATGTRAPIALPQGPNQRWSLDFVSDALSWGRKFRVLAIVDDFTREALALTVDTSLGGQRVVRELDALIAARGRPLTIVSDNGTELTSRAVLEWTSKTRLEWRHPLNIPLACWYEKCNCPFLVKPSSHFKHLLGIDRLAAPYQDGGGALAILRSCDSLARSMR